MKRLFIFGMILLLLSGCTASISPVGEIQPKEEDEFSPLPTPEDTAAPEPSPKAKALYQWQEGYRELSNPNASGEAKLLYNYLCSIYGNNILTGQQESTWMTSPEYEMQHIYGICGKLPAIRGLDYINEDFEGVNRRSVRWWEQGGIVSICWHWGTPPDGVGYESSKGEIDLLEALDPDSELHAGLLRQMDEAAEALLLLQEAGVPVLWRPFHEFDGNWFWWSKGGADAFVQLWQLMYERYTEVHGLNNLIWVLGYTASVKSGWYPGDGYVDIAGADSYNTGTLASIYRRVGKAVGEGIPVAYHECGVVPDPEALQKDGAGWLWFLNWHTSHITKDNTIKTISDMYNSDYGITLDELPAFVEAQLTS